MQPENLLRQEEALHQCNQCLLVYVMDQNTVEMWTCLMTEHVFTELLSIHLKCTQPRELSIKKTKTHASDASSNTKPSSTR